jgi:hypothetical protein
VAALCAGCGGAAKPTAVGTAGTTVPSDRPSSSTTTVAMPSPTGLRGSLLSPDILIFSSKTLSPTVVDRVRKVKGVTATEQFAMAQFYRQETPVQYAAVDPASFRRWVVEPVAESAAVWQRVAGGEMAIRSSLAKRIQTPQQYVRIGDSSVSPSVHVGAYTDLFAPTTNLDIDAVVNQRWVKPLGMVPGNALLVSMLSASPQRLQKQMRTIVGDTAAVRVLGFTWDPKAVQTVVLTGESVNSAVGTYNFTATADGRVIPAASWVRKYIRTVQVPILGTVSCNKVMIPQLVGALSQIQREGLAGEIHSDAGCFVPRYIAGTHQLSYHAFGLAIDINAPENQRGTRGHMDPRVVDIFRQWGFEWGGTWHYTDPMHFQLDRVVSGVSRSDP